jgi:K+-transporting ATPase ATPase B chain
MARQQLSLFDRKLIGPALLGSVKKLDPRIQWRNPVMFVVYLGTIVTAILYGQALAGHGEAPAGFIFAITIWLLFTVLFANFAEALAEGRSRAQASALRNMRQTVMAKRLLQNSPGARKTTLVKAEDLRKGDVVLVETHDTIPADGEVIEGVRVGAGHSRIGRRLLLGDRRHPGTFGLAGGASVGQPGRNISRPDDFDGRRSEAAKDPQ